MADPHDRAPDGRLEEWDAGDVHRVRISKRMLEELLVHGQTATAGSSLVGPELLVLETVHDAEEQLGIAPTDLVLKHTDA